MSDGTGFLQALRRIHVPVITPLYTFFRRLPLVGQFMLLSGPILLIGAITIGWWINRNIERQVLRNSLEVTSIFVDSTIAPHLWELASLDQITDMQRKHLDQLLKNNIRSGTFIAFHIAKPDGSLVYSNLPIPVGTDMRTPGMQVAMSGQVYSNFTDEIDFLPPEQQVYRNLIETYFPVRDESGTKIIAIASFYQSLDSLRQSILETQLQAWAFVGIATFLMYIALFSLVKRGSDTIERQRLDLEESRSQIQNAAMRAADVNEAAMRRLGAELHDGPAQDLGIALMRMEPLREALILHKDQASLPPDPEDIAFDLNLIHTALQSSLQEIRDMASGLRLPDLESLNLAETIRKAASDYVRKTGNDVVIDGPTNMHGSDALKSAAYRIVQEALNNGHLHGNPSRQSISFHQENERLYLIVSDNGTGFDPDAPGAQKTRRQLGLAGLQERAEILGGHLSIQSAPGQGTVIDAVIPLTQETTGLMPKVGME